MENNGKYNNYICKLKFRFQTNNSTDPILYTYITYIQKYIFQNKALGCAVQCKRGEYPLP